MKPFIGQSEPEIVDQRKRSREGAKDLRRELRLLLCDFA